MSATTVRTRRPAVLLLCCAALLTACGSTGTGAGAGVVRAESASVPPADPAAVAATATATAAFGLDLLHALTADPGAAGGNLVLSPSGLATVLAMVLPGARGTTAEQLAKALRTGLSPEQYALATGALNRAGAAGGKDGTVLRRSDDVWAQRDLPLDPHYLGVLAAGFGAGVRTTDFRKDPEGARKAVNGVVEKATEGRIKDLFAKGQISPDTRLALTDALYLKADWARPFKAGRTTGLPFHRLDGSEAPVPTMAGTESLRYAEGSGGILGEPWQAVELPYAGGTLAMDLIVPAQGGFAAFRRGLDQAQLDLVLGALTERTVDLTLPKFRFDSGNELTPVLKALGVTAAFEDADLSGIPGPGVAERLRIGPVVQKATVQVDEQGTVAAAGSGVGVDTMAAPVPRDPARLHIDRPFLFLVRDTATGLPLFLGQVTDPAA
ncbi:serpin family protein [Kitasatospora purpeofusca]|uniref:serpin family protein n=1 Tax=Kitasatospora purpeofusca TaxID=67352 RepID=UPI002254C85F|nr:serpin family protein [Kitasatospora purpeofusca]MCX4753348.1 serpin family protein [Kitasatospora purpeofusca]WSR32857.1 serpin family protein [Kitasatospora purpeofusca]